MGYDTGLDEQLRCEPAGERLDLACELAFLNGQLQHAAGDRAQRKHAAAQLRVALAARPGCCEALQEPCPCQRPQLAAERLRGRDQQIAQLTQTRTLGVDGSFASGDKCLQCLAFPASARRRRPLAGEHAAGRTDRVERVGLAARTALPPQTADLEHPLTTTCEEAGEPGTEGAGALDRERTPTRRMLLGEPERVRVAAAARRDSRLEHHGAAKDVHDRKRVCITVRVDANDVVQLICKHPYLTSSLVVGGHSGVGLGMETAGGRTVTGHALTTRTGF